MALLAESRRTLNAKWGNCGTHAKQYVRNVLSPMRMMSELSEQENDESELEIHSSWSPTGHTTTHVNNSQTTFRSSTSIIQRHLHTHRALIMKRPRLISESCLFILIVVISSWIPAFTNRISIRSGTEAAGYWRQIRLPKNVSFFAENRRCQIAKSTNDTLMENS